MVMVTGSLVSEAAVAHLRASPSSVVSGASLRCHFHYVMIGRSGVFAVPLACQPEAVPLPLRNLAGTRAFLCRKHPLPD